MKKEKLIEYNQKNILSAASGLFQVKGLSKTTVDEIARAADCSKATIYVYFKNKDDIYYHIVLEYMSVLRDGIKDCFCKADDYEKAYFSLCDTLVQFEEKYPMYFECILGNISVDPKSMEELPVLKSIYDTGEEINRIVCDFLNRGKELGFIKTDIDSLHATFVLWSSICGLISLHTSKQAYLKDALGLEREEFFQKGFSMILRMVKSEDH